MENIEFKAKCIDLAAVRDRAEKAGAQYECTMHQRDTYFKVPSGRMKLRTTDGKRSEMVTYNRSNDDGPRSSQYFLKAVRFPALTRFFQSVRRGILVEVFKTRELWLWRGVRIHLDTVEDLGTFMELEAVVHNIGTAEEAGQRCDELKELLKIGTEDMVPLSYSDLLLQQLQAK